MESKQTETLTLQGGLPDSFRMAAHKIRVSHPDWTEFRVREELAREASLAAYRAARREEEIA